MHNRILISVLFLLFFAFADATRAQSEWAVIQSRLRALNELKKRRDVPVQKPNPGQTAVLMAQYRRSSREELALLAPDDADRARFAGILKQDNTGLIKLVADLGCDEFSVRRAAVGICERFSMPGGGSAFSFRQKDYQMWKLADLLYDGKSLMAFGQMSLGFLVDIGKMPLADVTRATKGADYVFSFAPSASGDGSAKQNTGFVEGLRHEGFEYNKLLPAVAGHTYILRSTAYNGIAPHEERGYFYNELDYDKRKDVIVAFTVLSKDFNGTITLLWKVLQSKAAPVLS